MSWTREDTAGLVFVLFMASIPAGTFAGWMYDHGRNSESLKEQNGFCAQQGGRLVLGQGGERLCIDPRAIKWVRRPP